MKNRYLILLLFTLAICYQAAIAQNAVTPYSGEKFNSLDRGITDKVTATIIYDNYVHTDGLKADWGYSILLDGLEKTILFDTGTRPEIFRSNFEKLGLKAGEIDEVFISHEHGDHFGGLHELLSMNSDLTLVVPETFSAGFIRDYSEECNKIEKISGPVQICNNLYSTGVMGKQIPEQALVLNTSKGLIVMTGCSHPGIISILSDVKQIFGADIYMVFGGFHLMNSSDKQIGDIIAEIRELGVQKCGATHCTGEKQIEQFRKAFADNFVELGVGNSLVFE